MKKILPPNAVLVPDQAEKVFDGDIFDVYQWPQELFDGTTKTFEMLKRYDTVQIIAIEDGKIVMVEDEQPGRPMMFHMPGGRTDDEDQSWLAAAKREMLEETGKSFKNWLLIQVVQPAAKIEWFTPIFLATELTSQTEQNLDAGERIKVRLESFEDLKQMIFDATNPMLSYLRPLFVQLESLVQLLDLPEFKGQEVDR